MVKYKEFLFNFWYRIYFCFLCSPCQRSLLCEMPFDWSKLTSQTPLGSDTAVNIFSLGKGIIVASWKDGGGLAFVAANFHYNHLIQR